LLKVPELVPFRLTRNIIDPMGPCGTEGTFQEAAKETIAVLRKNARDLLTILSAVVADPLYQWQNDPEELQRRQNEKEQHHRRMSKNMRRKPEGGRKSLVLDDGATVEKNAAANRRQNDGAIKTVNKIKQKLDGYEDSALGEQQGVEGQVQLLINSARDLNLLAEMYPGWGPWT
jgi:ataxia telangiectasia mutated family protein